VSDPAVLVVDDDPSIRRMLARTLTAEGFAIELAGDGGSALAAIERRMPDAVVLDVMMPGLDGLAVCRRLRSVGLDLPILLLTARDGVAERVAGLDAGADDYVVKPFDLDELLARMRALLRRASNGDGSMLNFQDLMLDRGAREAARGARRIELTSTEYNLLELFMRHPRQVLTRSLIYERVWEYDFGPLSNSLSVYMGYLRRKLESGGESRVLHTVRGTGYVLREPAA
jgi:two-component system response regulator MprA